MSDVKKYDDEMVFVTVDGRQFRFYHSRDCCEQVYIEDVVGDLLDLVGSPILEAEQVSSDIVNPDLNDEWTFYRYSTANGTVTVRWLANTDTYYSTDIDFSDSGESNEVK